LEYLGHEWAGIDIGANVFNFGPEDADGILIASPTANHAHHIRAYLKYGKPILCEKPITKDLGDLERLLKEASDSQATLQMVNQYAMLATQSKRGDSGYNYFRHGSDSLEWDCINIIGLANGPVHLEETSPVWTCTINDEQLSIADMDRAYIRMIQGWLANPTDQSQYIWQAHEKTQKMRGRSCKS